VTGVCFAKTDTHFLEFFLIDWITYVLSLTIDNMTTLV